MCTFNEPSARHLTKPPYQPKSKRHENTPINPAHGTFPDPFQVASPPVRKLEATFAGEPPSGVPGYSPVSTNNAISKLRLPRKLLEKWVEEPFFEEAVTGCFVRLGVGKAPGSRSMPQYRVCEIVGVVDYKYSYAFGEFQTKKALMLRIGNNQRLWRMNVISNHRFTPAELEEYFFVPTAKEKSTPFI